MIEERSIKAIESSDTDELIRIVDGHCAARSWDTMVALRRRCDEAITRGKQLWGVSEYIRYRLALDAPGRWAGAVVSEGEARFTLGPLHEVAASTKEWSELEPYLVPGPERAMAAHERVVRGEDLTGADVDPMVMEMPLTIQAWEPAYEVVRYRSDRVDSASPANPPMPMDELPPAGVEVEDDEGCRALLALVEHWVERSNGAAHAICVEGDAASAIAALGPHRAGLAPVDPPTALAWMAWAAADSGAHGRRRGAAAGRFLAWWAAHEVAGLDWPVEPSELGEATAGLAWHLWTDGSSDTGWTLRLAIESPDEGLAWALTAVDAE